MAIVETLKGGDCLTTAAMVEATGIERRAVATACGRLVTRGWINRRAVGCFELSEKGREAVEAGETITSGPAGPLTQKVPRTRRRRTIRDKMWKTITTLQLFRLGDLETMAGASNTNARKYVLALEKAGYLIRMRREPGTAPTSNGFARWRLIHNTGPEAPVHRIGRREVYDRNTDETHKIGDPS
ncbi:putative transcriptional regulator of viral defense system [Rhodobium orientis]|nr:hypothetical protein [Rhodobium orientis]MBB4302320.1 putative transcriptional regulator of viral defense system [Rhodobium orientis]